jgi:membrane fusion protein
MRTGLFRQEALDHQREKLLGEVTLARPLSLSVLTALAVLMALAVLAFLCWGEYTRKARVSGYLAPSTGLIKVYVPQAGTLIEKYVREGQPVQRGDRLFVLSTERSSRETPETQAAAIAKLRERRDSLRQALAQQADIDRIQQASIEARLRGLEAELGQMSRAITTQTERVSNAEQIAKRYRGLLGKHVVSELEVHEKRQEGLDQRSRLQEMQREHLRLERELRELRLDRPASALKAQNERAAMGREIAALEQELTEYESRRTLVITAPSTGVVTAILAERGQNATPASPLLSILPTGARLEAQLLVPSRAIGFVAPGQTVAVRYQAFPYQRFGSYRGEVKEISRTLIEAQEAGAPISLQESVYRVTVGLKAQTVKAYGEAVALQSGMLLEADIWLDHRRLIEWIFDPLYSITGHL